MKLTNTFLIKGLMSLVCLGLAGSLSIAKAAAPPEATTEDSNRQRLIVITDIGTEPDDFQSMVRLLTYANEFDIEGLIASTSKHFPDESRPDFIESRIEAYGKVLPNLRVHAEGFPDAEELLQVVRGSDPVYGIAGIGKGKHREAAELIIKVVDSDDLRPVWVTTWGGSAPLAQALWQVNETRSKKEIEKFVSRLRVYAISDQDDTAAWIRMTFPKLFWVSSMHAMTQYHLSTWAGITHAEPGSNTRVIDKDWIRKNVQPKGPLGAMYPSPIFGVEGDTPSFLYLLPNGLGNPERPDWGSWGGRYGQIVDFIGLWTDVVDNATGVDGKSYTSNKATVWRWREAFQNDFAARMDWTITPEYENANHPPKAVLNGEKGSSAVHITACADQVVELSAAGSSDPDKDKLDYSWFFYGEVNGNYSPVLELSANQGVETTVVVPQWRQPYKIALPDYYHLHVVLVVEDNGTPSLTRYRRAVLSVPSKGQDGCEPVKIDPWPEAKDFANAGMISASRFSIENTIGELLDNPEAHTVLKKHLPGLVQQMAQSEQSRSMTLSGVAHFSSVVTEELLDAINKDLAEID